MTSRAAYDCRSVLRLACDSLRGFGDPNSLRRTGIRSACVEEQRERSSGGADEAISQSGQSSSTVTRPTQAKMARFFPPSSTVTRPTQAKMARFFPPSSTVMRPTQARMARCFPLGASVRGRASGVPGGQAGLQTWLLEARRVSFGELGSGPPAVLIRVAGARPSLGSARCCLAIRRGCRVRRSFPRRAPEFGQRVGWC